MAPCKFIFSILLFSLLHSGLDAQNPFEGISRFREENSALMKKVNVDQRIVFIGNSITEGWFHLRPEFFANKPYVNRGISGETTAQMLLRFRQDVIDLNPSAVVIMGGTNDIAWDPSSIEIGTIVGNIISMTELALANNIKVILCSVLPTIGFYPSTQAYFATEIIEINRRIKNYADSKGLMYVDYHTAMADESNGLKKHLGYDTVHPNQAGYLIMEPILKEKLRSITRE